MTRSATAGPAGLVANRQLPVAGLLVGIGVCGLIFVPVSRFGPDWPAAGGVRFGLTMDDWLARRLDRLYAEGQAHDARQADRLSRRRNLEPTSASLLAQLVRVAAARAIVEIGTSNGYSTIWLADAAAAVGGQVVSVDNASTDLAQRNLAETGLADVVNLVVADGGDYLAQAPSASIDFLFLDAERTAYLGWWPEVQRVLRPGGLLVIDNALAPDPAELTDLLAAILATDRWTSDTVPIGKGLFLAGKASRDGTRDPGGPVRATEDVGAPRSAS